ncbi:YbaB/EbfC family nucleoid-associated protein [Streptomyces sp. NPDC086010]|uniref:YbaB/EbfC family nucleoid-associated protein n=1 Tax=Streptomyces sp. NPDC086010 TaxID=3365745 RepID=UPI0037D36CCD
MNPHGGLDIDQLLQSTQRMQQHIAKAQEELGGMSTTATAGGGAVKVTVDSKGGIESLVISPVIADPGNTRHLAEMVVSAVREAQRSLAAQHEAQLLPMLLMLESQLGKASG